MKTIIVDYKKELPNGDYEIVRKTYEWENGLQGKEVK